MGAQIRHHGVSTLSCKEQTVIPWSDSLDGLVRSLPQFGEQLSNLPSETEAEFLSIGSSLQVYHEKSHRVSELSAAVASMLAGDDLARAMEGSCALLTEMGAHISEADAATRLRVEKFKSVLETTKRIEAQVDDFARLSKSLRILGVTTKIYAANDGSQARDRVLAKNISSLSGKISGNAQRAAEDLRGAAGSMKEALQRLHDIKDSKYGRMRSSLNQLSSGLMSLQKLHNSSRGVFGEISSLSQTIAGDIEEVVMSAQYQDITRQKFMQARQAIGCLAEIFVDVNVSENGYGAAVNLKETTVVICERVLINLLDARGAFINAVESILDSLNDVSAVLSALSAHIHAMTRGSTDAGRNFIEDFEEKLVAVKSSFAEVFEAETEVASAVAEAGNAVLKTMSLIRDIEEIGDNVDIIAMNAAVRSAQSNGKGSAMGVLSGAIRKVSEASNSTTLNIATELKKLTEDISGLLAGMSGGIKLTVQKSGHVEQTMGSFMDTLDGMNREVMTSIGEIDAEVRHLSESITDVVDNTNSHYRVDKVVGAVVTGITSIAREWGGMPVLRDYGGIGCSVNIDNKYAREASGLSNTNNILPGSGEGPPLGSNIELFE